MVSRYVLLALLLFGCAGNQSALPMPPAFSPVEDAPIFIGQPGTVAPKPEKSPHKRLLPQTPESRREAGLWAGDVTARSTDKRGGDDERDAPPTFLDVELPLGESLYDPISEVSYRCARRLQKTLGGEVGAIMGWTPKQRACAVARVFRMCVKDESRNMETIPSVRAWAEVVMQRADAFMEAKCPPLVLSHAQDVVSRDLFNAYLKATGRGRE